MLRFSKVQGIAVRTLLGGQGVGYRRHRGATAAACAAFMGWLGSSAEQAPLSRSAAAGRPATPPICVLGCGGGRGIGHRPADARSVLMALLGLWR